jgi:hypothetical protein
MYGVILKPGSYDFKSSNRKGMVDLNLFLSKILTKLGVAYNKECCGLNNLKLKQGVSEKEFANKRVYFDFEKWLYKQLEKYNVVLPGEYVCCESQKSLQINKEFIYFKSKKDKKTEGLSLNKWLKDTLVSWNVEPIDCQC